LLVTVAGPRGRRDLSLPADAPVAELLPVLVRLVGDGSATAGWTLTPTGGRPLPAGSSLAAGGVLNGALLHLETPRPAPAAPPPPPAPPPPRDGRTPVERTAAALPPRHPLPERASLAARALLDPPPESHSPGNSAPGPPPRFKGGLVLALLRATEAAAGQRSAPPGAAAFAPVGATPGPAPAAGSQAGAPRAGGAAERPADAARQRSRDGARHPGGRGGEALERVRRVWRSSSYLQLLDEALEAPRLQRPVTIAVAAARHGAGATTVTGLLGTLLASHRQDRVVAVDAGGSDHPGSLARALGLGRAPAEAAGAEAGATGDLLARLARALPAEVGTEQRPAWLADDLVARLARAMPTQAGLDARLGRAPHGLAVLPAPAERVPLDERGWRLALERLRSLYPLVLVDCGTELAGPAGRAAVRACDQLLLVSDADPAGASLAVEAGLPLTRAGLPVTLVVNRMPASGGRLDLDRLGGFLPDARGLVTVPSAPQAAAGLAAGTFTWPGAAADWRRALHELAATLVADWPRLGLEEQ
jgi:MinD-like ATPase involved in chromosome partitioning or flagellar assembly